jgi:hypothetical protein
MATKNRRCRDRARARCGGVLMHPAVGPAACQKHRSPCMGAAIRVPSGRELRDVRSDARRPGAGAG